MRSPQDLKQEIKAVAAQTSAERESSENMQLLLCCEKLKYSEEVQYFGRLSAETIRAYEEAGFDIVDNTTSSLYGGSFLIVIGFLAVIIGWVCPTLQWMIIAAALLVGTGLAIIPPSSEKNQYTITLRK